MIGSRPGLRILLCLCLALLLGSANRGFELTDESFYLAWIVDPGKFRATLTPFGLPLHLVFAALGHSLIALRVFGIALLAASGGILGASLKAYYRGLLPEESDPQWEIAGSLFALSYYSQWILTPSYNLLANVSGAFVFAGMTVWIKNERDQTLAWDWIASSLVGVGGCVAFFAKPTLAVISGLAAVFLILGTGTREGWILPGKRAATVCLLCVVPTLLIIQKTVGIGHFIETVTTGLAILHFGNSPSQLLSKTLFELLNLPWFFLLNLAVFSLTVAWRQKRRTLAGENRLREGLFAALYILNLGLFTLQVKRVLHSSPWDILGVPTISFVLAQLSFGLSRVQCFQASTFLPVGALLLLPFVSAFGTAASLPNQTGIILYPILFASTVGARACFGPAIGQAVQLAAAAFVLFLLVLSATFPFKLPISIFAPMEPVALPFTSDVLRVHPSTKLYVEAVREAADRERPSADTPILDLSGTSVATALLLQNGAPVYPWLYPGTHNSAMLVDAIWDSLTPERKRMAWIVAPVHPTFALTRAAQEFQRNSDEYRLVDSVRIHGWGDERTITLWKPEKS